MNKPSTLLEEVGLRKMFRLLRPKLVAEFAIFFLIATAVIQIAVHVATGPYALYHISAPKPSSIAHSSALEEKQTLVAARKTGRDLESDLSVARREVDTQFHTKKAQLTAKKESAYDSIALQATNVTISNNGLLKNISKPYYNIVTDGGFKVNRTYFRVRPTRISSVPDKFRVSSGTICNSYSPSILFVIPSVASSQAAIERLEIRRTWASDLYGATWRQTSSTRLAFFFGSSGLTAKQMYALQEEARRYGDIVVGDFLDSYHNLSLKMAVTITWVARHCPHVKAAIKIDMDTYVNVKLLLSLIDQLPVKEHPNYIFGHMHGAQHPLVVRTGVWAVPEPVYPFDRFPRYIYGHSYVISGPAVKLMADSFPFFPIVPNEDAFATGIMTVTLNITRFHHDSFAYLLEKRTLCNMTQGVHVTAVMKKENKSKLWNAFKTGSCINDSL